MGKRLSLSDYLFALLFIFMLACILGAFFYGVNVGTQRTEDKYQAIEEKKKATPVDRIAYHQQHLVSFYHTVFMPYRDFQVKWFEHMTSIAEADESVDPASLLKELGKLADQKASELDTKTLPASSPLLVNAQKSYLQSLELFSIAVDEFSAKSDTGDKLIQRIQADKNFIVAQELALKAQRQYFAAMVKWHASVNPELAGLPWLDRSDLNIQNWNKLGLTMKNALSANVMEKQAYYAAFNPQDLTARIDETIRKGLAAKRKLTTVNEIAALLYETDAVRPGDYLHNKTRYYAKETLPQLPFLYEQK